MNTFLRRGQMLNYNLPNNYQRMNFVDLYKGIYMADDRNLGINYSQDKDNLRIYCEFQPLKYASYGTIYAVYQNEESNSIRLIFRNDNNINNFYFTHNWIASSSKRVEADASKLIHFEAQKEYYIINGTQFYYGRLVDDAQGNLITKHQMTLGGAAGQIIRFKRFMISRVENNHNITKCDYIPCKNDSGQPGLYDIITKDFVTTSDPTAIVAG